MTYTALASLILLQDDLSRVDRTGISNLIASLCNSDGRCSNLIYSFRNTADGENDIRFVYCTAVICFILNDWKAVSKVRILEFILACQVSHSLTELRRRVQLAAEGRVARRCNILRRGITCPDGFSRSYQSTGC
jgi:hypothetical protein